MRPVKRVLLYRLGSLGDHLVAMPCYRLVARVFPQSERRLLTNVPVANKAAAAEAVLGGSGLVQGYLTYVVGERSPWALAKLWWSIVRFRPDVMVYLAGARGLAAAQRDARFFKLCGVRKIVGLPLTAELQENRALGERNGIPWFESEAERLARCVAELGDVQVEDAANWSPGLTQIEREKAAELIAPLFSAKPQAEFFAMSLGTKAQSNEWGVENWRALLEKIAVAWPGNGLVLLGASDESAASETLAAAWRSVFGAGAALNLCGACTPRVSAAVMERARMFLGHDSGPAHMAGSVGAPVLGIYSSRMLPGTWFPHGEKVRVLMHWVSCGGCLLETCTVERKRCILSIGVDEAVVAMKEHMRATER